MSGARNTLLLSVQPVQVLAPYTGPNANMIAFTVSGTSVTGSFGSTPPIGDLLVACVYNSSGNPIPTVATGWTSFDTIAPGTGGLHPANGGVLFAYHYVVLGDTATFTPATMASSTAGCIIFDVSGANATWATAFKGWNNTVVGPGDTATISSSTASTNNIVLGSGIHSSNSGTESGSISGLSSSTVNSNLNQVAVSGQTAEFVQNGTTFTITMTGAGSIQPTATVAYILIAA